MSGTSPLSPVIATKEAARYMGLSYRTLEDWRLTGKGPPFCKFGRLVRYRVSDLAAFIDRPSFTNTAEAHAQVG